MVLLYILKLSIFNHLIINVFVVTSFFSYLVSDAANPIRNAFQVVFGTKTIQIMCWFHVTKCAKDKIKKLLDKQRAAEVMDDLRALHYAPTKKVFGSAVALFKA